MTFGGRGTLSLVKVNQGLCKFSTFSHKICFAPKNILITNYDTVGSFFVEFMRCNFVFLNAF